MENTDNTKVLSFLDKYAEIFQKVTSDVMSQAMTGVNMDVNPVHQTDNLLKNPTKGVSVNTSSLLEQHLTFLNQQRQCGKKQADLKADYFITFQLTRYMDIYILEILNLQKPHHMILVHHILHQKHLLTCLLWLGQELMALSIT